MFVLSRIYHPFRPSDTVSPPVSHGARSPRPSFPTLENEHVYSDAVQALAAGQYPHPRPLLIQTR